MTPVEENFAKRSLLSHLHFPVPPLSNPGDCGKMQPHLEKTGTDSILWIFPIL